MPPQAPPEGAVRRRVLASAYACDPGQGSEPGIGWNWARQIARRHQLTLLTRVNNVDAVRSAARAEGLPMEVLGHDLPPTLRAWKRGSRGAMAYAYLWQRSLVRRARLVMAARAPFDVAHHLTFASGWMPSGLAELGLPFVFGPVGEHPRLARGHMGPGSVGAWLAEGAKAAVKGGLARRDPAVRRTWDAAGVILSLGDTFERRLPARLADRLEPMLACGIDGDTVTPPRQRGANAPLRVAFAGRLVDLKGVLIALRAFALARRRAPMTLELIGDGRRRADVARLARQLGVAADVRLRGRLPHRETLAALRQQHVFLFPSFEGGGMVVPEAMAAGLAVVCLDTGGPGAMVRAGAGIACAPEPDVEGTAAVLAAALLRLEGDEALRTELALRGQGWAAREATWDAKGARLDGIYGRAITRHGRCPAGAGGAAAATRRAA